MSFFILSGLLPKTYNHGMRYRALTLLELT
jgi:hypothetical protein